MGTDLLYLQVRPRWFGERDTVTSKPPGQSYIETQYRRLKRFFNWLVSRNHVDRNPFDLIPHPHVDEKIVPTVAEDQMAGLLRLLDPSLAKTKGDRFRILRNRAALFPIPLPAP